MINHVSVSQARSFGIVGSALTLFLLLAPRFGGIVNLIGAILLLVAVWSFSVHLKNKKIFFYFFAHVVVLIGITILTSVTANYYIEAFEDEKIGIAARLLQVVLALLPLLAAYLFFKSYRMLAEHTDVQMFTVTAIVQASFSVIAALLNLALIFTNSPLAASISLLLTFISYLIIPVLGAISYIRTNPNLISYRSRI